MLLAILLALMAATAWGTSAIFARLSLQHMRATTGTVVSLAVGVFIVAAITFGMYGTGMFDYSAAIIGWAILVGLLNYPLGRLFNFASMHLAGVGRAAPILAGAPVVAAAMGVAVGGETLTLPIAVGIGGIVGGVVLIVSERRD